MTLPCLDHRDMLCNLPKPCRYLREINAGMREPSWVVEHGKCDELKSRAEDWKDVADV